ncbi:hypothetical protein ARZXY2_608 [Arthrobacter sp. ZXY-2]|nr:hypothetical protein ARZXY2_608 [Arthrobacter sp. ZXY-2]
MSTTAMIPSTTTTLDFGALPCLEAAAAGEIVGMFPVVVVIGVVAIFKG